MSDTTTDYGCETCDAKVLRLAAGNEHECDECGQEWVATAKGVWPADELPA